MLANQMSGPERIGSLGERKVALLVGAYSPHISGGHMIGPAKQ